MAQMLKIGHVDSGKMPADLNEYFKVYHFGQSLPQQFRGNKPAEWFDFEEIEGTQVRELQIFLRKAGFFPKGELDGIFGYRLQSAVRLFQEYVRTVEGKQEIGCPDGVVGGATFEHVQRWKAANNVANWSGYGMDSPTREYYTLINYLNKMRENQLRNPQPAHKAMAAFKGKSDSLKTENWDYHPKYVHLIGIRRKAWETTGVRANDDIFLLLINGMVFKFLGTTDPSQKAATRADDAFIVHGQHLYTFSWQRLQSKAKQSYIGLRPAEHGVFVANSSVTEETPEGLSLSQTVNIDWAGHGANVWVPGHQGIAGKSYINHHNDVVSCASYSAANYSQLSDKTKGAYNVMFDLLAVFSDAGVNIRYSVIHEKDLAIDALIGSEFGEKILEKLKKQ